MTQTILFRNWVIGIIQKITFKSPPLLKGGEGGLAIFIVRGWRSRHVKFI